MNAAQLQRARRIARRRVYELISLRRADAAARHGRPPSGPEADDSRPNIPKPR